MALSTAVGRGEENFAPCVAADVPDEEVEALRVRLSRDLSDGHALWFGKQLSAADMIALSHLLCYNIPPFGSAGYCCTRHNRVYSLTPQWRDS